MRVKPQSLKQMKNNVDIKILQIQPVVKNDTEDLGWKSILNLIMRVNKSVLVLTETLQGWSKHPHIRSTIQLEYK